MEIRDCMKHNVYSLPVDATIRQAAELVIERHISLLPIVDGQGRPVGVIRLNDLLSLELPDFFNLLPDLDFVHDFGAVETTRLTSNELDQAITALIQPATFVDEACGLLRAYALMVKRNLHDLPVIGNDGKLMGIASRVDIAAAILTSWRKIGSSTP